MIDYPQMRQTMVASQLLPGNIIELSLVTAFQEMPRELFMSKALRSIAYSEQNLLDGDRVMMAPLMLAKLLKIAHIQSTDHVLHMGFPGGYGVALLSRLCEKVTVVACHQQDIDQMAEPLQELNIGNVSFVCGPLTEGCAAQGPYDIIFIEGAVEECPDTLMTQLKPHGRMVTVLRRLHSPSQIGYFSLVSGAPTFKAFSEGFIPYLPGFNKPKGFQL